MDLKIFLFFFSELLARSSIKQHSEEQGPASRNTGGLEAIM